MEQLKDFNYYLTGSLSLYLNGVIQRESEDIDLMSNDEKLLEKLSLIARDVSDAVYGAPMKRYSYQNTFIDVFPYEKEPEYKNYKLNNNKIKLVNPKMIMLQKLSYLESSIIPKKQKEKSLTDLKHYFNTL